MAKTNRKIDRLVQRPTETHLQWQSRLASERDFAASKLQAPVTPEARRHGLYEQGFTEVDGQRREVLINRGGSTIQRWMNAKPCSVLGDRERAAIRYCQKLWARLDYKGPREVVVDCGGLGEAEHQALAELAVLKGRSNLSQWQDFANICRWEYPARSRFTKDVVGAVARMIADFRNL